MKQARVADESFSQAIKRLVRKPIDMAQWFAEIDADPISSQAARAMEEAIGSRCVKPGPDI